MYYWQDFQNNPNISFEKLDEEIDLKTIVDKNLEEIEKLLGKDLPEDYVSFCRIFGTVSIDGFAEVYIPSFWEHKFMMDVLLDDIKSKYHRISAKNESIVLSFLERAFWFGKTNRSDLLFDLTTTNDSKTSSHVYMLQKDPKKLFFVSDSFYHFVNQFCCGNTINHLPKKISPKYQENHILEQFNASFSQSDYEYHQEMIKSIKSQPNSYSDNLDEFDMLQLKNETANTLLEASIKVGIKKGDYKDKVLIAQNLLSLDIPVEQVSLAVGLSLEELINL